MNNNTFFKITLLFKFVNPDRRALGLDYVIHIWPPKIVDGAIITNHNIKWFKNHIG